MFLQSNKKIPSVYTNIDHYTQSVTDRVFVSCHLPSLILPPSIGLESVVLGDNSKPGVTEEKDSETPVSLV